MKLGELRSVVALCVAAALPAGCGGQAVEVGAPPRPDATVGAIDPMVAQRIEATLSEIARAPAEADLRGKLGMLYHEHGLPTFALTAYGQALALDGDDPRWPYHLAAIHVDLAQADVALALYARVLALESAAPHVHRTVGFLLLDLGRADEAKRSFDRAHELDAADVGTRVGLARVHLLRGEHEAMVALMRALVAEHPGEPYFHQLLGVGYQRLGRIPDARAELTRSTGVSVPEWDDPWRAERVAYRTGFLTIIRSSETMLTDGRGGQAVPALRELLLLHPGDVVVMNTLAQALLAAGEPDEALTLLQEALELDPRSFATHANLAHVYESKSQPDLARSMEHARQSIAINPTFSAGHLQLGRLQTMERDYPGAAVSLRDALAYGEEDPEVRLMYARVLNALGRFREAVRAFQQVIQRRPRSAAAHVGLSRALMEMGSIDAARRPLRQAQILDPRHEELAAAIERFRELGGKTQ